MLSTHFTTAIQNPRFRVLDLSLSSLVLEDRTILKNLRFCYMITIWHLIKRFLATGESVQAFNFEKKILHFRHQEVLRLVFLSNRKYNQPKSVLWFLICCILTSYYPNFLRQNCEHKPKYFSKRFFKKYINHICI